MAYLLDEESLASNSDNADRVDPGGWPSGMRLYISGSCAQMEVLQKRVWHIIA